MAGDCRVDDLLAGDSQPPACRSRLGPSAANSPAMSADTMAAGRTCSSFGQAGEAQAAIQRFGYARTFERAIHVELMVSTHLCYGVVPRLLQDSRDDLASLLHTSCEREACRTIAQHSRGVGPLTEYSSRPLYHLVVGSRAEIGNHVAHAPVPSAIHRVETISAFLVFDRFLSLTQVAIQDCAQAERL